MESMFEQKKRKKEQLNGLLYGTIDYRCEDGCFPVSASCVTISNPDSLSSSEKGFNHDIRN
jgi:hypothetical protein